MLLNATLRNAFAALVLVVATAGPGLAQTSLTSVEREFVSRNPLLVSLQREDPKGFRKVLDLLVAHNEAKQAPSRKRRIPLREEGPNLDVTGNPDLQDLQKSSPEAAHELFQVLKQAGALKPKKN
jgi:hypothetical protein